MLRVERPAMSEGTFGTRGDAIGAYDFNAPLPAFPGSNGPLPEVSGDTMFLLPIVAYRRNFRDVSELEPQPQSSSSTVGKGSGNVSRRR